MNHTDEHTILQNVSNYYSQKIDQYGCTPNGVDWKNLEGQEARFEQLTKVITQKNSFSLHDLGCGYGALFQYLNKYYKNFRYTGIDISLPMIDAAQKIHNNTENTLFLNTNTPSQSADYCIASGIFNVCMTQTHEEWENYIFKTLETLNQFSLSGFAFNFLTSYADKEKMKKNLYYADPCKMLSYCLNKYSKHVTLLHHYNLYEFTVLVYKE